jgi:hypothetical protein
LALAATLWWDMKGKQRPCQNSQSLPLYTSCYLVCSVDNTVGSVGVWDQLQIRMRSIGNTLNYYIHTENCPRHGINSPSHDTDCTSTTVHVYLTGIHRLQVVTSWGLPSLCESTTKIKVTLLSKQQLQRPKSYSSVTNITHNQWNTHNQRRQTNTTVFLITKSLSNHRKRYE